MTCPSSSKYAARACVMLLQSLLTPLTAPSSSLSSNSSHVNPLTHVSTTFNAPTSTTSPSPTMSISLIDFMPCVALVGQVTVPYRLSLEMLAYDLEETYVKSSSEASSCGVCVCDIMNVRWCDACSSLSTHFHDVPSSLSSTHLNSPSPHSKILLLTLTSCTYEPEVYPAVIYHFIHKATALVFVSGRIVLTGFTRVKDMVNNKVKGYENAVMFPNE